MSIELISIVSTTVASGTLLVSLFAAMFAVLRASKKDTSQKYTNIEEKLTDYQRESCTNLNAFRLESNNNFNAMRSEANNNLNTLRQECSTNLAIFRYPPHRKTPSFRAGI